MIKTILGIKALEYTFEITFTDSTTLEITGHNYEDSQLEVYYNK